MLEQKDIKSFAKCFGWHKLTNANQALAEARMSQRLAGRCVLAKVASRPYQSSKARMMVPHPPEGDQSKAEGEDGIHPTTLEPMDPLLHFQVRCRGCVPVSQMTWTRVACHCPQGTEFKPRNLKGVVVLHSELGHDDSPHVIRDT